MRKTLLALAPVATLVVSAVSPAYAGPRYDYGPGGNPCIRALIPEPAAIRTGRAMSMPRLESRSRPATG